MFDYRRIIAVALLLSFTQLACYNRHVIETDELAKLESGVERQEQVSVYSDCSGKAKSEKAKKQKCRQIKVSATNPVSVMTKDGQEHRVTPFNFMMSKSQLVSPEYDKLLPRDNIKEAEVRRFSTWKTVGTIVGVSGAAIGTFVAISVLAPSGGFQE
jgi:hypothetical protein